MVADPEGYGPPGWRSAAQSPYQSDEVRIDPMADRYFSWKQPDAWAAVLIGLKDGVAPADLLLPPVGSGISRKAWEAALKITPAFIDGAVAQVLAGCGYATGEATGRFLTWLTDNPAVQALVRSISLSAAPTATDWPESATLAVSPDALKNAEVVLAVIDDWIGVANQRFRLANGRTRCIGLWLQGINGAGAPPPGFSSGRGLDAAEINTLLAAASDEEDFERMLYPLGRARPTQRLSHGTHVADLFAGYGHAPAAEAKEGERRPIIGVALPHNALRDTSGLPLLVPLVNAVAFVMVTVLAQGGITPPPIVINYSNGAMADICQHYQEARDAITAMMEIYNTVHAASPMAIVTAAGNSFQEQGFARLPRKGAVPPAKRLPLDLRIMPDDKTRSYVTFELPPQVSAYSLTAEPPGLPAATVDLLNRSAVLLDAQGRRIAQLLYDPPSNARLNGIFTLIVEPTADPLEGSPGGLAPPGIWRLTLGGAAALTGGDVKVSIARDVAPLGFPTFGRQARFEDPAFEKWGAFGRPGDTDKEESAVQRGGAMNVLVGDFTSGPVSVASRIARSGRPTDYSSAGATLNGTPPTLVRAPDVIADAEESDVVMGMLATGIRTGSFVAMNGTSVSAPIVARGIASVLAQGLPPSPSPRANAGRIAACQLTGGGSASTPPPDARRGHGGVATTGRRNVELAALRER